jgi:hypothetical protein
VKIGAVVLNRELKIHAVKGWESFVQEKPFDICHWIFLICHLARVRSQVQRDALVITIKTCPAALNDK